MARLSLSLSILALLVSSALGGPTPLLNVERYDGPKTGRYIVSLKPGVARASMVSQMSRNFVSMTHEWDEALNGFAANLDEDTLNSLRASQDVESISEDGIMHIMTTQTNAPWGLSRLSSAEKLVDQNTSALTFTYTYNETAGAGVDIYIIGIRATHSQFGGRAKFAAVFGGYPQTDGHGHGTHVAGTAVGSQFGVAKAANVFAIRVMSDSGSGSTADIVSGMNFALASARSSGRPSIVSMSLGGAGNVALDNAAVALVNAGVHVVVAAGNANVNAANTSPARVPVVITVGASNIADAKASFSNFGPIVDVFAPGQNIISSWKDSDTATNSISGTSMATPHVAGLVAYLISLEGNVSPGEMEAKLKNLSQKNVLTGVPTGTVNILVHNA